MRFVFLFTFLVVMCMSVCVRALICFMPFNFEVLPLLLPPSPLLPNPLPTLSSLLYKNYFVLSHVLVLFFFSLLFPPPPPLPPPLPPLVHSAFTPPPIQPVCCSVFKKKLCVGFICECLHCLVSCYCSSLWSP